MDKAASVLQKKRSSEKYFKPSPIHKRTQDFSLGRPKPQITCYDVIKNFQEKVFVGQRYRRMEDLKSVPVGT